MNKTPNRESIDKLRSLLDSEKRKEEQKELRYYLDHLGVKLIELPKICLN